MSEKRQAWVTTLDTCDGINSAIENAERHLVALRDGLSVVQAECDKAASDYAAERVNEGANVVEDPSGNLYTIKKARKKKGGAEPPNAYALEPVKR